MASGSTRRPRQSRNLSKNNVLLLVSPSNAPHSTKNPFLCKGEKISVSLVSAKKTCRIDFLPCCVESTVESTFVEKQVKVQQEIFFGARIQTLSVKPAEERKSFRQMMFFCIRNFAWFPHELQNSGLILRGSCLSCCHVGYCNSFKSSLEPQRCRQKARKRKRERETDRQEEREGGRERERRTKGLQCTTTKASTSIHVPSSYTRETPGGETMNQPVFSPSCWADHPRRAPVPWSGPSCRGAAGCTGSGMDPEPSASGSPGSAPDYPLQSGYNDVNSYHCRYLKLDTEI